MNPVSLNSHTHASSLLSFPLLPAHPLWLPSPHPTAGPRPCRGSQHPTTPPCPSLCPLCPAALQGRVAAVLFQAWKNKSSPLPRGSLQGQGAQGTPCPLFCQGGADLGAFGVPGWAQATLCTYSLMAGGWHLWRGWWKSGTRHVWADFGAQVPHGHPLSRAGGCRGGGTDLAVPHTSIRIQPWRANPTRPCWDLHIPQALLAQPTIPGEHPGSGGGPCPPTQGAWPRIRGALCLRTAPQRELPTGFSCCLLLGAALELSSAPSLLSDSPARSWPCSVIRFPSAALAGGAGTSLSAASPSGGSRTCPLPPSARPQGLGTQLGHPPNEGLNPPQIRETVPQNPQRIREALGGPQGAQQQQSSQDRALWQ